MCTHTDCSYKKQRIKKAPPEKQNGSGDEKNKELTYKQRCQIEGYDREGFSVREIADFVGKSRGAIGEELKRGRHRTSGEYCAEKAQYRRYVKRHYAKTECNTVAQHGKLQREVERRLRAGHSPESIAAWSALSATMPRASAKSIRKFVRQRPGLERYLFWNRNDKKSGPKRKPAAERLTDRRFIDERPEEAEYEYGHWEGDFIVSKDGTEVLLVLVEKYSKLPILRKLANRNNDLVNEAVVSALQGYTVQTLTLDNDIAFKTHCQLEDELGAPIYFTHPYCSWEKGLVENTNRWVRQFIPKRANLRDYTEVDIQNIEDWHANLPRPCLNGWTPYEMMMEKEYGTRVSSLVVNLPTVRIRG